MQAFIVEATNRPGEFARQTAAIAARGINLYGYCITLGTRGASAFLGHDEAGVRSGLNDAGIAFREVPVVTAWLEDKPGTAAAISKKLADAGVNIELFVPLDLKDGKATMAIGVDNVEAARRVLSDQLTEWMVPGQPSKVHAGTSVS
jgi:hypothetical protein